MTKKILLADDEEDILMLVSATLGGDDRLSLILARDGEESLRLARQERPDLIFLDVMMPKMDGFEVCRQLKSDAETAAIKIVMLTAMTQDFDRRRADDVVLPMSKQVPVLLMWPSRYQRTYRSN